jgi:dUTP pyrophosphatase
MRLNVKRLDARAIMPSYAHEGDAGLDLFAIDRTPLGPGRAVLVRTGIAVELPAGTEAQVRPRSGLALRHSVTVLNTPGTIDEGYRGEIGVILINHGDHDFIVEPGTKIAQLVVSPRVRVEVAEVPDLQETSRGAGGFGSTGR